MEDPRSSEGRPGSEAAEGAAERRALEARGQEIFEALVQLPHGERQERLAELAGDDVALRREVETLLSQDAQGSDFLAHPGLEIARRQPGGDEVRRWIGEGLGPYEILRKIGSGGMSHVFLARRSDGEYRMPVAVKVLRRGFVDPAYQRRFRTERQILASLDHPNISRLLDGGTTPDGEPYLVMEYIPGDPLLEYCDRLRLPIRQRLELFRKICRPIQFAHQKLVVHRDLKPSNILITEQGLPKLLDFGIAKLLHPSAFFVEPERTGTLDRFLTPSYASPEQAEGRPVTAASDVYALGVVLYELLCGRRPDSRSEGGSSSAGSRHWELPEPPSLRAKSPGGGGSAAGASREDLATARSSTPRALSRRLAGDLDRIALKALQPSPEDRYDSVEGLSEDLRRHLSGLPILARPAHFRYRAAKFLRRNLLPVAASIVVAAGLLGFGLANALKSERLARQVEEADRQRTRAEEVTRFLVETFTLTDPVATDGKSVTAEEILRRGAQRIQEELAEQPEIQASIMLIIGEIHTAYGLHDEAQTLVQGAVDRRRGLFPEDHPDLLESLDALAFLKIELEEFREAQELAQRTLAARREALGNRPPGAELAQSLSTLGWLYSRQGDSAGIPLLRESLEITEGLQGPEHPDTAASRNNLALALNNAGRIEEAEALFRELVATFRGILPPENPHMFLTLHNHATTLQSLGRLAEAESIYREALVPARKVFGDQPLTAKITTGIGLCLFLQGEPEAAEPFLREALDVYRRSHGPDHPDVGSAMLNLANLLTSMERCEEARPLAQASRAMEVRRHGEDHWKSAIAGGVLAGCLARLGDETEAERLLVDGYRVLERRGEASARQRRDHLGRMISFFEHQGRGAEAERYRDLLRKEQEGRP